MTYVAFSAPWLVVLVLLWALLVGQPAGAQASLDRIAAQSTENAYLRSQVYVRPTNTPYTLRCLNGQLC